MKERSGLKEGEQGFRSVSTLGPWRIAAKEWPLGGLVQFQRCRERRWEEENGEVLGRMPFGTPSLGWIGGPLPSRCTTAPFGP
jgi:hypothetical protein